MRSDKSREDRQYNDQRKRTINDLQNTTRTSLKTRGELSVFTELDIFKTGNSVILVKLNITYILNDINNTNLKPLKSLFTNLFLIKKKI